VWEDRSDLFDAASYAGGFASLNLPPLAPGLGWTNRLLADGSLAVVATIPPTLSLQRTPSNALLLSWPSSYVGFQIESQTNPRALGLSTQWFAVPGGTNNPFLAPLDPARDSVLFRLRSP
jgi:hypothetical protein